MGVLSGIELLSRYVHNGRRNVDDLTRFLPVEPYHYENLKRTIADCVLHMLVAKRLGATKLVEDCEDNLLDALNAAGMNVGDETRRISDGRTKR